MKIIICLVFAVLAFESIEGRTYGPPKRPIIKKDPVIIPDIGLKKDPIHGGLGPNKGKGGFLPDKIIPPCNVGCTLEFIPVECRQETFGFENGVRCQGCDLNICQDKIGGGIGGDRWSRGGINTGLGLLDRGLGLDGLRGNGGFGQRGLDRRIGGLSGSRLNEFGGLGSRFNGDHVFGDIGTKDGLVGGLDGNGGFGRRHGLLGDLDRNTGFGGRVDRNDGDFGSRFRTNTRQGGLW